MNKYQIDYHILSHMNKFLSTELTQYIFDTLIIRLNFCNVRFFKDVLNQLDL